MAIEFEQIENDFDRAEYFQNMLFSRSTGGEADEDHYVQIRQHFLANPNYSELIPRWIKTNRNLDQFWQFIKNKFPSYAERRGVFE